VATKEDLKWKYDIEQKYETCRSMLIGIATRDLMEVIAESDGGIGLFNAD